MKFRDMIIFWNGMISDVKSIGKYKPDFSSVLGSVLISGSIAGAFFGMGYGFFYLDITNTVLFSLFGIFFGPLALLISLILITSFYFLTCAVFGARKTTTNKFFGPQSAVHSLFSIIFGIIYAVSGLLSVLDSTASRVFFSAGLILFAIYYVYVMSYLLHFQTGFSKNKSLGMSLIIPATSLALYISIKAIFFLASAP